MTRSLNINLLDKICHPPS